MSHSLVCIEVAVVGRNLYTTLPSCRTKVVVCARIIEHAAINGQMIVVESLVHRAFGGTFPKSIGRLVQHSTATASESETNDDRFGIWCTHSESGVPLRVDHRIWLA